ncbi:MAG: hypothetical protein GEU82_05120 [Luteitalea sp.]|nr:hypothetical protein [Luteitalea sp.]
MITDQAAFTVPAASGKKIVIATVAALLLAIVILVTAVLPAEYGLDPLGIGGALGLTALAGDGSAAVARQSGDYKVDSIEFVLGPYQSVEYKYRLAQDATMLFSWQATDRVVAELHSEPDGAAPGYAESFDRLEGTAGAGSFRAPFPGIHGWYWENAARKELRISLKTAGFYTAATEFFDGDAIDHPLTERSLSSGEPELATQPR